MAISPTPSRMTFDEYLVWEARQSRRHEFIDGIPVMMAGAAPRHVSITPELSRLVGNALVGSPCRYLDSETKLRVGELGLYPDGMVACPPEFLSETVGVIENSTAIFEVLSPSTQGCDLGIKFEVYARLPSLRDYVVIYPDAPLVHVHSRRGDEWVTVISVGPEAVAHVPNLGVVIPRAELYARLEFEPDPVVD